MKSVKPWTWMPGAVVLALAAAPAAVAQNKKICVEVVYQDPSLPQPQADPGKEEPTTDEGEPAAKKVSRLPWEEVRARTTADLVQAGSYLPIGQTPVVYLKRLLEHFVTHEVGYIAVQDKCDENIRVELYPLTEGWTVFARYSGNGREERVDQLFPTELSQFAERSVLALLRDAPISTTINRDTVLKADSKKSVQRIRGTNHFVIGLGTQLRGGEFGTAADGGSTEKSIRVFSPMTISTGYRGKFESWGIEALAQLGIGTSRTAPYKNSAGGHIDLGGNFGLALHFLRYLSPRGLTSFYLGAGANFELLWFSAIKATDNRGGDDRSTLLGGGLDLDVLFGWEFMRASSVQFFLQGELNIPAYVLDNEDDHGALHTYFPGFAVKLGVVF